MTNEILTVTTAIKASAETIFAVLADPTRHPAIDGTERPFSGKAGEVREALDKEPISTPGQVFRMAMYHPNYPNGDYETANLVTVFQPPRAIAWNGVGGGPPPLHALVDTGLSIDSDTHCRRLRLGFFCVFLAACRR